MATVQAATVTKLIRGLRNSEIARISCYTTQDNTNLKNTICKLHEESIKTPPEMHSLFLFKNRSDSIYHEIMNIPQ